MTTASGLLRGRFPYVRFGAGPHTLVLLTGLALDNEVPGTLTAQAYTHGFRRFAGTHTVYILQRGHGLPAGATTRDIAGDYARLIGDEIGPARIIGMSTGGMVAQHLALDHPGLVERLVLVVTGARLAPAGEEICRRWLDLAAAGRWRRLRGDLATAAVDGAAMRRLARLAGSLTGGATPPATRQADFQTTVAAVLAHDTRTRLPSLEMPTLLIGGAEDPFFPAAYLRETAAAIPGATLHIHDHSGHGLPKQRSGLVQDETLAFLDRRA
ncbi:alpha/beta fold hydrolase [Nonomuraea sp. NPDC049709]|uniref:alpha/beta fold hydrolase n=1 Tax=Nonomuraea sp. NPDC049709 TaxID=3154736 RepID=UPI00341EBE28